MQELASASLSSLAPSPPTPFPSASAWEIWALQSHTRAEGVLLRMIFETLNLKVPLVGRRRTVGEALIPLIGNVGLLGGRKKPPCSLGPRLLRRGCHSKKMSSPHRTPSSPTPNSNLKLRNRERWLRKIFNVCALTISCPAPDGIVFHSGATQMVPQSGLKS